MFYNGHALPHFHAVYAGHEIEVGISPIAVLQGSAPRRVCSLVLEWVALHQQELLDNWDRCRGAVAPVPIPPLE